MARRKRLATIRRVVVIAVLALAAVGTYRLFHTSQVKKATHELKKIGHRTERAIRKCVEAY